MSAKLIDGGAFDELQSRPQRRAENMALVFQEALTVIVRLRSNSQPVADPKKFRADMRAALQNSGKEAARIGYTPEDARLAAAAVTAFLDESIGNSENPEFWEWSRAPLHEELYGHQDPGEAFSRHVTRLLGRGDSQDLADVLEVYLLCLLLGYRGNYRFSAREERQESEPEAHQDEHRAVVEQLTEKIRSIRKSPEGLPLTWRMPEGPAVGDSRDSGARRLWWAAGICLLAALLLFVGIKLWLGPASRWGR
jgi:type VI secretion system protein ImpK